MTEATACATSPGTPLRRDVEQPNSRLDAQTTDNNVDNSHLTVDNPYQPTARDLILLDLPTDIKVAPDGKHVALTVRTTNWRDNRYESICYLYTSDGAIGSPLNRSGSVQQMEWLDDRRLALLKAIRNGKAQIWVYEGLVGEGWQVTEHEGGVHWFVPFADGLLYRANRKENQADKERGEAFGLFRNFEHEESRTALYYVDLSALRDYERRLRHATPTEADAVTPPIVELSNLFDEPRSIRSVVPCPSGKALYINCWRRDDLIYFSQSSCFRIEIDTHRAISEHIQRTANAEPTDRGKATEAAANTDQARATSPSADTETPYLGTLVPIALPRGAEVVAVSPDGETLLIDHQGRDEKIYTRSDLWRLPTHVALTADETKILQEMHNISAPLDRDLFQPKWTHQGIFAAYIDGAHIRLAQLSDNDAIMALDLDGHYCTGAFDVGDGGQLGVVGVNATEYPEAYLATPAAPNGSRQLHQLTAFGEAIANWQLGTVETIYWKSKDGTEIEGVLRKPANFDPNRRYPLVFVVHGGPRGYADASLISTPDRSSYPTIQFSNADILVLYPNYRGSTGRGQAFTELNVNNLGIGDLWDLESAIDHLAALGWIDETRIGCMGWSQGGYISAFAGLHSERFRAVSVGAGISDWYTYHISNDIPYFTTDYLSGSPFHNREYYAPTAPMSNIAHAKTPMLIQHGSEDQRVPLSNAMELYRGLQAMNVPVELYIYPGMGHPITKPRENHAVMCQNWEWFTRYLL